MVISSALIAALMNEHLNFLQLCADLFGESQMALKILFLFVNVLTCSC